MSANMEHLVRSIDLIPLSILETPIVVVGAGAVGSCAVLALAKMGFSNLTVWDADIISVENIGNQLYRFQDIGKPKVYALEELCCAFARVNPTVRNERFQCDSPVARRSVVVSAVDSMTSRKVIWSTVQAAQASWLLDPRMGAEFASLRVGPPGSLAFCRSYAASLFDDSDIPNEPCTAKSTIYTAMLLGGLVAQTVRDCLLGTAKSSYVWDIKRHILETE